MSALEGVPNGRVVKAVANFIHVLESSNNQSPEAFEMGIRIK